MATATPQEGVTTLDKYHCAKRELNLRRRVYPHWITAGRISTYQAAQQLKVMEAIVADYFEQMKREELDPMTARKRGRLL